MSQTPQNTAEALQLDGMSLSLADVAWVARSDQPVAVGKHAMQRMEQSHAWVMNAADGTLKDADGNGLAVYGVNTGYGSLARVRIDNNRIAELSWNLVRSHAAGVGPEVSGEVVRAMMLLRANALARGASGCQPGLVVLLTDMINKGVTPVVPQRGSCGSSGDLAPLAHLGLVLFRGEDPDEHVGEAWFRGMRFTGPEAMAEAGLTQLIPGPKDGLAILNGAQLTCAIAALACYDTAGLIHDAEIAAAMSFDALLGVTRALHPAVHQLRPFPGAIDCAADLRALLKGSQWCDSVPDKVQDAYSLRCTPQVLGAVRDAVLYAARQVQVEVNSVTDNPVIILDEPSLNKAHSSGLFHGEPLGFAADHLKLALCELGSLSERRLYRLTTGALSSELPPLLQGASGIGLALAQTTAAALVAENRQLAWPCTADSIPTCEDQEDHVAMSTTAARRAARVLGNARRVICIELLAATYALRVRRDEHPDRAMGEGVAAAFGVLHDMLEAEGTGIVSEDLVRIEACLVDGRLREAVTAATGPLTSVIDV
jgi:histidine ammonia-lyase